MKSKRKWYCCFTLIYWLLITMGLILFGLAFQKIPINHYGLRRNFFSSYIQTDYYPAGNYYKDVGYYFLTFPSSKVYLPNLKVNVTNKDMQIVGVQYTLVYRLFPAQLYNLYSEFSDQYEGRVVAIVNSIVSEYFTGLSQNQTRVTVQPNIVTQIQSKFGNKLPILQNSVQVQAFWLNGLNFYAGEADYEKAYLDTTSYSEAYEAMQIELQKTNLKIQTLKNLLQVTKQGLKASLNTRIIEGFRNYTQQAQYRAAQKKVFLSKSANVSQIFQYYQTPKFVLV